MARQVAHEIKNPLTPMKLSIQHFQRTWTPEVPEATEKLQRFGESLVQQIDALSRIAGEFSAFAQMPAAQESIFDLREVADAGIALFKGEPNADIVLHGDGPLRVKADREQLLRAVNNLLKNALQSIPEDRRGAIDVTLRRADGEAVIEVRDNGGGIRRRRVSGSSPRASPPRAAGWAWAGDGEAHRGAGRRARLVRHAHRRGHHVLHRAAAAEVADTFVCLPWHREIMSFANLLINDASGIRTITINRPQQLNALNRETIAELDRALNEAEADKASAC
jgi:hypothetical protein